MDAMLGHDNISQSDLSQVEVEEGVTGELVMLLVILSIFSLVGCIGNALVIFVFQVHTDIEYQGCQ